MKTSRFFIAFAISVIAFASCQKETPLVKENNSKTIKFIAQSIDTKTAFGAKEGSSYPTLWTENDENVKISLNFATPKDAGITPSADFKSATFEATIEDDESGSYTFYSISPASAYTGISNSYKSITFTIPTTQTPTSTSVDEAAQIIAAKSSEFTSWPSEVGFDYSHVTAYGKMSLSNLNLGTATITSIALTAEEDWAGRWYYYPVTEAITANSASATITINTTSTSDIWFACAPVDLSGKTITVTVNTSAGPFEKEITWPTNKPFTSGKVYKFAVDMTGITAGGTKTYTKVTSTDDLTVDSEVIIVAAVEDFAMSTTQNSSNRGAASVTKTSNTIDNPGPDVQVFKAKKGNKNNTIAFFDSKNYIYASSSSANQLKSQSTLNDNASFSLTITDENIAQLVAQGSYTRNVLQYNPNNGKPLFSCYASDSQYAVCLYKLNGSGTSTAIFVPVQKHTLTLSSCTNGSVSATIGGKTVNSGDEIEEGTEVTITATPATGYKFSEWSIIGATAAGSTASTTITVGESDITVSATFEEDNSIELTAATLSVSSLPEGWSGKDEDNGTSYVKLIRSTSYIQSPEIECQNIVSVKIKARKFGGPSDDQARITISFGEIDLGTIIPSSTSLTDYTIDTPVSVSGKGKIKIACLGASSSKGSGVSAVTINYTPTN